MKTNHPILFLFVTVIVAFLITSVFVIVNEKEAVSEELDKDQVQGSESHGVDSISKETILLLLAVGVIGALGVSRTKRNNGNGLNRGAVDRAYQAPNADGDRRELIGRNF